MKLSLTAIHDFLKVQGLISTIVPKTDDFPVEQLYVGLGCDEKQRDLILQIKVTEEDLNGEPELLELAKTLKKKRAPHHHHLQFLMALPFLTETGSEGKIARLILLINKSMSIPGFEFSEVDKMVYFRSVLLINDELDELVLMALIGNLVAQVESFSSTLES